jgi:methylaspartate mutase epsilon subunit
VPEVKQHTVLLGGIGGDSHSVGLNILRQALTHNGFEVLFLGIQNQIDDFYHYAELVDAVLISNMDGHAFQYLSSFGEKYHALRTRKTLWYLGGNLVIGDNLGAEKRFLEMGFHRVFVKFVDIETVLKVLKKDLHKKDRSKNGHKILEEKSPAFHDRGYGWWDDKIPREKFLSARQEVLSHWRTGQAARDLDNNARFLKSQPNFCEKQKRVHTKEISTLVQPRSGVATVEKQISLFRAFRDAGAGTLSYQVDSFTRNNNYPAVEEILKENPLVANDILNGFPVINHGVGPLRKIIQATKIPLQTRHSTRDPRLLAEISLAGGVTAFEGGPICYNIPYYKNYPISEAVKNWQYVDRLAGFYFDEYGILIDREFFGVLTATLIPPSMAIIVNILQSILAVQQGVKCLSVGYAEQGNRFQDIAAIECLREITHEFLLRLGYKKIQINTIYHQYMAAFPPEQSQAEALIKNSSTTAGLAQATRMLTKTPVEAIKIPSLTDNVAGINLSLQGLSAAQTTPLAREEVEEEKRIIRMEVEQLFEEVVHQGGGKIVEGIIRSFAKGILDVPFSPSVFNRGEVITARDQQGAVRYLQTGALPFSWEIKEFHRQKISERRMGEKVKAGVRDYLLVERDVMMIARGQFEAWPLYPA